jgi:hypothetical protein
MICDFSFISKENIWGKGLISLQLLLCPLTELYSFKNGPHAVPGVMILGKGEATFKIVVYACFS